MRAENFFFVDSTVDGPFSLSLKKKFEKYLKMNKLPLVLFTLCIASASCVKLEGLCPQDLFGYNGVIVTAFYRSRLNITFPPLNEYLINSSIPCEPSEFVNKTNHEVVMGIRDK